MVSIKLFSVLLGLLLAARSNNSLEVKNPLGGGSLQVGINNDENALEVIISGIDGAPKMRASLGLSLPSAVGQVSEDLRDCPYDEGYQRCFMWGDYARVNFKPTSEGCFRYEWTSSYARELMDCIDMDYPSKGVHWYGGGEMFNHIWPIDKLPRRETPYVPSEGMGDHEGRFSGVAERFWLLSNGALIFVDMDVPLFYSLNTTRPDKVCYIARDQEPYTQRSPLKFNYEICAAENAKEAHLLGISKFYSKPEDIPDERMLLQPLWSTWAEYKTNVNQSIVLEYARKVVSEGFVNSSHIEIDDHWESCYGMEEFNPEKFPNPKEMIDEIKRMGMRVTAWVHPFVNNDCPLFKEGFEKGYFVKNVNGKMGLTFWWQGDNVGLIDVTNPEAAQWWTDRLRKLQTETGLDSYKFDAGEAFWLPAASAFNSEDRFWPQIYTQKFVETCAAFGGMIEVRTAMENQKEAVFFRMLDKDSKWSFENGLRSIIPNLFQFGMNGYPYIMPDMIGGNNYGGEDITQEFYVRWMQLSAFVPQVQFSFAPWRVGKTDAERDETVRLCLLVLALREKYSDEIIRAARQSVEDGSPMNRPLWWVDPTDSETFAIDDEYMLGDSILIAPVVYEGQMTRDVYLPRGTWVAERDSAVHTGPLWLRNYPAPLDAVPVFVKSN